MTITQFISKINSKKKYKIIKIKLIQNELNEFERNFFKLLLNKNFILSYNISFIANQPYLIIKLKYTFSGKSYLNKITQLSTKNNQLYLNTDQLIQLSSNNLSYYIVSTNNGLQDIEYSIKQNIGGKLMYQIQ